MYRPILLLIALLPLIYSSKANPIDLSSSRLQKSWEWCVIHADDDIARVSCAVGYTSINKLQSNRLFAVPIYWPVGKAATLEAVSQATKIQIEIDGRIYKPTSVSSSKGSLPTLEPTVSKSTSTVYCRFEIDKLKLRNFSMVVSYDQPLIDHTVYYLPLFEKGIDADTEKNFKVTFFPSAGKALELLSTHKGKTKSLKTRVTVTPRSEEFIAVKLYSTEK